MAAMERDVVSSARRAWAIRRSLTYSPDGLSEVAAKRRGDGDGVNTAGGGESRQPYGMRITGLYQCHGGRQPRGHACLGRWPRAAGARREQTHPALDGNP